MRWQNQSPNAVEGALPGLERAGFARTVQTPEFDGITFHEVLCKSALNKVPAESKLPFQWTINPMRGCSHACRYCFARGSHEYLELDAGTDFDTQIVVKTNIAAILRRELTRRSWHRERVALGTNTDPYQRAEGRYRLMPGIIRALTDSGTPFSILTKGTLLRRDLPLLSLAAREVGVHLGISLALLDPDLHHGLEPGTPSPRARLELVRACGEAGFAVNVMVAPVIPYLTDGHAQLDELFGELAASGAESATVLPLNLRGSTRDWFLSWLADNHPALLRRYRPLYRRGGAVAPEYASGCATGSIRSCVHTTYFPRVGRLRPANRFRRHIRRPSWNCSPNRPAEQHPGAAVDRDHAEPLHPSSTGPRPGPIRQRRQWPRDHRGAPASGSPCYPASM